MSVVNDKWYANWFDKDYLTLYGNRSELQAQLQVESLLSFYSKIAHKTSGMTLDLGCGSGRHSHMLAKSGLKVIGLDLSSDLLDQANQQYDINAWVRADMRCLPFATAEFGQIVNFFTSFGYFIHHENEHSLIEWARVLKPNGILMMDYMDIEFVKNNLITSDEKHIKLKSGKKRTYFMERKINKIDGLERVEKKIRWFEHDQWIEKWESVALYNVVQINEMMQSTGLKILEIWDKWPNNADINRKVIFAKKTMV